MGQILHGSATTTEAIRRAIQNSQASLRELATRYSINPKTVAKWRRRGSVCDARMRPKEPRSTVLSKEEEALIVTFRGHTLLPLDDCLYALQPTIPHRTRSSLHRCLQRHGISRLPETQGDKPAKRKFKSYPIGYFHVDIAEMRTEEGKLYLFVAIDRTSKFAYAELHEKANRWTAQWREAGKVTPRIRRGIIDRPAGIDVDAVNWAVCGRIGIEIADVEERAIPGSNHRVAARRDDDFVGDELFDADALIIPGNRRVACKPLRDARIPDASTGGSNDLVWDQRIER